MIWKSPEACASTQNLRRAATRSEEAIAEDAAIAQERQLPAVKTRRIFDSFTVALSPVCEEWPTGVVNDMHRFMSEAMTDTFFAKAEEIDSELMLRYVVISKLSIDHDLDECIAHATIGNGVASFTDPVDKTPDEDQVNEWALEAMTENLVPLILASVPPDSEDESSLRLISTVTLPTPSTEDPEIVEVPPTQSPSQFPSPEVVNEDDQDDQDDQDEGQTQDEQIVVAEQPISSESGRKKVGTLLVACVAVGVLATTLLIGSYVFQRRRRKDHYFPEQHPRLDDDGQKSDEDAISFHTDNSPESDELKEISPVVAATLAVKRAVPGDEGSIGSQSETSFTIQTEAGDTSALKSIATNSSGANLWNGVPLVSPESFEYQRSANNLQKDMLTSTWSGRVSSSQGAGRDSVLQPSYFSASQERRRRRMELLGPAEPQTPPPIQKLNSLSRPAEMIRNSPSGFIFQTPDSDEEVVMGSIVPPRAKARNSEVGFDLSRNEPLFET